MRFSRLLVTAIVFGLALFAGSGQIADGSTTTVDGTAHATAGVDLCPGETPDDIDGDGICARNGFSPPMTGDNDNCPSTANPDQANADGDRWGDACEIPQCVDVFTYWETQPGDDDCDAFTTTVENFIGTDPFDSCAEDTGANNEPPPDAWPVDMNDDSKITTFDVVPYIGNLNTFAPGPPYTARLDLTTDGIISVFDVVPFVPLLKRPCAGFP